MTLHTNYNLNKQQKTRNLQTATYLLTDTRPTPVIK